LTEYMDSFALRSAKIKKKKAISLKIKFFKILYLNLFYLYKRIL